TGATDDFILAIDKNVIAGVGVGIAGDVRHASSATLNCGCRDIEAILPSWKRENIADAAASRSSIRQVVPDYFADNLFVRSLQCGATTAQCERTGSRKINVVVAVIDSIRRTIVTGGDADGYTHSRGRLKGFVEVGERLRCPLRLGSAPAYGNDRGLIGAVVYGGGDGVKKTLICVRGKIDDDFRSRSDRAGHFDVEHHFPVRAVRSAGAIRASIDRHGDDLRFVDIERGEIVAQVIQLKTSA